jgi:peptidoglycan/xylan/chitin deacetylase (PgdA/CDA1 family)
VRACVCVRACVYVCVHGNRQSCGNCPADCGPCQLTDSVSRCVEDGTYALSFDDGPSAVTNHLLDILSSYDIPVTFFLIGRHIDTHGPQIQREEAMGFSTLSHTYSHEDLTAITPSRMFNQLYQTNLAFERSGACRRPTLYRPPYGSTTSAVRRIAGRMGYRGVVWNMDTKDWLWAESDPEMMLQSFKGNLTRMGTSGVLQLQHDVINASVKLIPQVRLRVRV